MLVRVLTNSWFIAILLAVGIFILISFHPCKPIDQVDDNIQALGVLVRMKV